MAAKSFHLVVRSLGRAAAEVLFVDTPARLREQSIRQPQPPDRDFPEQAPSV